MVEETSKEFDFKHEALEMFILFAIVFVSTLIIPFGVILFNQEAFSLFYDKYSFYIGAVAISAMFILAMKIFGIFTKGKIETFIHDPTLSPVGNYFKKVHWINNPLKLYIFSLFCASFVGLLSAYSNTFFALTPGTLFQINPISNIYFGVEPAATSETLIFLGLFSLVATSLNYGLGKYYKNSLLRYTLQFFALMIVGIFFWRIYHNLNYGGEEIKIWAVILFAFLGTLFTWFFHSIFVWLAFHQQNNFYFTLNDMFGNDQILIYTILINLFVFVPLLIFYVFRKKKIEHET